ncbi:Rpn family recombination-promoting nuclease/putative transposase [Brevibacillus borstelensis]|uniref:Rpn family recombination-promoting nuclease/putative transposase n=1 Tax=Brevibacillus borstelensis TaxID=45462 RepID=UPI001D0B55A0|nr:Rpn family recombination-promoting nuclease/putative transposase [Brevibacillus borstelensis]MCC0567357.1 Rpn family recombination-promoting nuclease/putative transposase [Brevibacillus borstelensis]MCM3561741.1 Rpn family recombination-promoting nuclease/putative transposase [Brevibacillus borstelensis]MCM3590125.1 Rpn family recombination-promoting nuclease/putative transposase [Brevibacillus borstelensis]
MTRRMDLKVDYAFKLLFGTQENEPILRAMLNALLKLPKDDRIASLTILNSELLREHETDKQSVLDIYARTEKDEYINIEIQVADKYDMKKRTLYYWSRIYSSQLKKGSLSYGEMKKTITINILDFDLLQETVRYHSTFRLYEDEEKFLLTDVLEVHFVEMPKLLRLWEQQAVNLEENEKERWLLILEADDREDIRRELEAIAMKDPVMKKAIDQWEDLSRDEKTWIEYETRKKAIHDELSAAREAELRQQRAREEGLAEGRTEGERQKATEVAKNLLAMDMTVEVVAKATGLSLEEIEKLKKQLH